MSFRKPVVVRCPVTNESLMVDSAKQEGKALDAYPFYKELLVERIVGLVRNLSIKYQACSSNDFEDLVQDCLTRVWSSRATYNPARGGVTTWVWRVCSSVLNSDWRKSQKYKGKIKFWSQVSGDETGDITESDEIFCSNDMDAHRVVAMRIAVDELYQRHGKHASRKAMLDALFCVEDDGIFVASAHRAAFRLSFPGSQFTVDLSASDKKKVQKKTTELMRFVRTFVRPVISKHMGEE